VPNAVDLSLKCLNAAIFGIEIAIEIGIEQVRIAAIFDFDSDPDFDFDFDNLFQLSIFLGQRHWVSAFNFLSEGCRSISWIIRGKATPGPPRLEHGRRTRVAPGPGRGCVLVLCPRATLM
jgi:hypothetical protein